MKVRQIIWGVNKAVVKCQVKSLAAVSKNSADLYQPRTWPANCHGCDSLLAVPGVKDCGEMDGNISKTM